MYKVAFKSISFSIFFLGRVRIAKHLGTDD